MAGCSLTLRPSLRALDEGSPLGRPWGQGCFLRQERGPTSLQGRRAPPEAAGQLGGGGRTRAGSLPWAAPRPAALGTAG